MQSAAVNHKTLRASTTFAPRFDAVYGKLAPPGSGREPEAARRPAEPH